MNTIPAVIPACPPMYSPISSPRDSPSKGCQAVNVPQSVKTPKKNYSGPSFLRRLKQTFFDTEVSPIVEVDVVPINPHISVVCDDDTMGRPADIIILVPSPGTHLSHPAAVPTHPLKVPVKVTLPVKTHTTIDVPPPAQWIPSTIGQIELEVDEGSSECRFTTTQNSSKDEEKEEIEHEDDERYYAEYYRSIASLASDDTVGHDSHLRLLLPKLLAMEVIVTTTEPSSIIGRLTAPYETIYYPTLEATVPNDDIHCDIWGVELIEVEDGPSFSSTRTPPQMSLPNLDYPFVEAEPPTEVPNLEQPPTIRLMPATEEGIFPNGPFVTRWLGVQNPIGRQAPSSNVPYRRHRRPAIGPPTLMEVMRRYQAAAVAPLSMG